MILRYPSFPYVEDGTDEHMESATVAPLQGGYRHHTLPSFFPLACTPPSFTLSSFFHLACTPPSFTLSSFFPLACTPPSFVLHSSHLLSNHVCTCQLVFGLHSRIRLIKMFYLFIYQTCG